MNKIEDCVTMRDGPPQPGDMVFNVSKAWWVPWLAIPVLLFPRCTNWLADFIINHGVTVEPAA